MNIRSITRLITNQMWFRTLKQRWRRVGRPVKRALLCVTITFIHAFLFISPLGEAIEGKARELWFSLRGPRENSKQVTIVRVDVPAYRKVGISPSERLPREILAKAIKRIADAGPKIIILDFLLEAKSDNPAGDEALADALATTPIWIARTWENLIDTDADGNQRARLVIKDSIPMFAEKAQGMVFLQSTISPNGLIERITIANPKDRSEVMMPLLEPLSRQFSTQLTSPGVFDLINFYGAAGTLTSLSLADLMDDTPVDPAFFKDRVVFVGMMIDARLGIQHFYDVQRIPVNRSPMWGVEIQATMAGNLLDKSWIRRAMPETEAAALSVAAFVCTFIIASLTIFQGSMATIVMSLIWGIISFTAFVQFYRFIPGATLFLVVLPIGIILRISGYAIARWRESRRYTRGT